MPTVTIHATPPSVNPNANDETYASQAERFAAEAQASASSAGHNRDAIEAILAEVGETTAFISNDDNNRLKRGSDGGYYVLDGFSPDPLAYYILAKG